MENDYHRFPTKIVEVEVLKSVVEKLDSSIERLTEVNNNISKLLAVHERRLDGLEKDQDNIEDKLKSMYSKSEEMNKELSAKMDVFVEKVYTRLDENFKRELEQHVSIEKSLETKIEKKIDSLSTRIDILERWKWWVIGASFGCGIFLSDLFPNIPLV